jgi:hypothetical protein
MIDGTTVVCRTAIIGSGRAWRLGIPVNVVVVVDTITVDVAVSVLKQVSNEVITCLGW